MPTSLLLTFDESVNRFLLPFFVDFFLLPAFFASDVAVDDATYSE
jgi:hypothetical protein